MATTEYEPGDSVLIRAEVVEYIEGVGVNVELFSKTDQYQAWVRTDLVVPRGAVVIDFDGIDLVQLRHSLARWKSWSSMTSEQVMLQRLLDQIEAQTEPPRIPEPGRFGVISAVYRSGRPWTFVRGELGWVCLDDGSVHDWDDLTSPTLIREGVES